MSKKNMIESFISLNMHELLIEQIIIATITASDKDPICYFVNQLF